MIANKVVLLSCSKAKRAYPCVARQLYDASTLFRKSLAYAESIAEDIFVLSAKHGLVGLDDIIVPYDETLNDKSAAELVAWGKSAGEQIAQRYDVSCTEFVILAGKNYYSPLRPHLPNITLPLLGLPMGERLAKLDRLIQEKPAEQSSMCHRLHKLFNSMPRLIWNQIDSISFDSGIYVVFENGEIYNNMDRIVRVGTHRSNGRLRGRLKDHFIHENKDGSIFRKNIGRAILNKNRHPYLDIWNANTSKTETVARLGDRHDMAFQQKLEKQISDYIREHFSFICFPVPTEAERLRLEEGIIATLNNSLDFTASAEWRGQHSPEYEIAQSGMWLKEGLSGIPLSNDEYLRIESLCSGTNQLSPSLDRRMAAVPDTINANQSEHSMKTSDIMRFIAGRLEDAKAQGATSIIIKSGTIHKELCLVSRMPMVCGAMRKLMRTGDIVRHSPPKGNGATLEIEYYL